MAGALAKLAKVAAQNPEAAALAMDAFAKLQGAQTGIQTPMSQPTMSFPQPPIQSGYISQAPPIQTGYMPQTGYVPQDSIQTGFMPQSYYPQSDFIPPQSSYPQSDFMPPQPAFYMPEQAGPLAGMPVSEEQASTGFSFFALFYSFGSAFLPFIWVFLQPTILPFMFGQIILFGGITLGLKYMADWEWRNSAIAGWLVQGIIFFFIYYFINRNVIRLATGF